MIHSNETQGDLMQATESGAEINKKNWCQFRVRMIWDDKNWGVAIIQRLAIQQL